MVAWLHTLSFPSFIQRVVILVHGSPFASSYQVLPISELQDGLHFPLLLL